VISCTRGVADQHSFDTDPFFRMNTDPDPIRIQGFNDRKLEKFIADKINFFGSKTTIYLALGLHKERPSYRRNWNTAPDPIPIQDFNDQKLKKNKG
jgi:hypothetical protein